MEISGQGKTYKKKAPKKNKVKRVHRRKTIDDTGFAPKRIAPKQRGLTEKKKAKLFKELIQSGYTEAQALDRLPTLLKQKEREIGSKKKEDIKELVKVLQTQQKQKREITPPAGIKNQDELRAWARAQVPPILRLPKELTNAYPKAPKRKVGRPPRRSSEEPPIRPPVPPFRTEKTEKTEHFGPATLTRADSFDSTGHGLPPSSSSKLYVPSHRGDNYVGQITLESHFTKSKPEIRF